MPINANKNIHEQFFNLSIDMLCIANSEGYFKTVNPAFTSVLGYSEDELLSRPILDFIHPDDIDKTLEEFAKLSSGQDSLNFENRYRHKDNHYLNLSWNGYIDNHSGLIYSVARDITQQFSIQKELQHLKHAIEQETIYAETDVRGV